MLTKEQLTMKKRATKMDNDNFSYTFCSESGTEWVVEMENGKLVINNCHYERNEDDPTYDFAIAMHKVINEKS